MVGDVASGVQEWWAPALAFAAGVVSFASPCVLPLVPGYLSLVAGGQAPGRDERWPLFPVLLFILGFAAVFTLVGALGGSALARVIRSREGQRVAGAFVLLFGVFMLLYAFRARLPWLYREGRPLLARVKPGPTGAFPLGMAFAVGWTPCIGPVLAAIFGLALAQGSTVRAGLLFFVYSLGLGLPFLLIGLGVRQLMGAFRFFSRNYHWFAGASGAAMAAIGILLISGTWTRLMAPLFQIINRFTPPI
jgi:cytochrome c-type biogenesis protein